MKKEFDEYLCSKYPKLFETRHKDVHTTAMCWGFSCGDGWFQILNQLCSNIQSHIDWKQEQKEKYGRGEGCSQVVVDQVKEKFGTLRFYYHGGDEYINGLVRMAESMSGVTCESCGAPGALYGVGKEGITGWMHTYCEVCETKRNEQLKA